MASEAELAARAEESERALVADLVGRAMDGDEGAWRELVERYSGRVFAMIHSRVRHRGDSEDLTQTVFAKVVDQFRRGSYREEGRFEPWLFRIAMNLVRDRIRRERSGPRLVRSSEGDAAETDAGGLGGGGDQAEQWAALREAIDGLPEADREVLSLRHFGGLGFREIAEALGEPVGTLLARHHRALGKLRARLSPAGKATT